MAILPEHNPLSVSTAESDFLNLHLVVMGAVILGAVLLTLFGVIVVLIIVPFASLAVRRRQPQRPTSPSPTGDKLPDARLNTPPRHTTNMTPFAGGIRWPRIH